MGGVVSGRSKGKGARVLHTLAALALAFTIGVAVVVPSRVPTTCAGQLDCFDQLNITKVVLLILGALVTLTFALLGAFRTYLSES